MVSNVLKCMVSNKVATFEIPPNNILVYPHITKCSKPKILRSTAVSTMVLLKNANVMIINISSEKWFTWKLDAILTAVGTYARDLLSYCKWLQHELAHGTPLTPLLRPMANFIANWSSSFKFEVISFHPNFNEVIATIVLYDTAFVVFHTTWGYFNIKMPCSQYRDSYHASHIVTDKSYIANGNPIPERRSLYWTMTLKH